MTLDDYLFQLASGHVRYAQCEKFKITDIRLDKAGKPQNHSRLIPNSELESFYEEERKLRREHRTSPHHTGRLLLVSAQGGEFGDIADSKPFRDASAMRQFFDELEISASIAYDIDFTHSVAMQVQKAQGGRKISISCRTRQLVHLTVGLTYDSDTLTTSAFMIGGSPVEWLLRDLENLGDYVDSPMLLPLLFYWKVALGLQQNLMGAWSSLNKIKQQVSIFDYQKPISDHSNISRQDFQDVHRELVEFHRILTGDYEFLDQIETNIQKAFDDGLIYPNNTAQTRDTQPKEEQLLHLRNLVKSYSWIRRDRNSKLELIKMWLQVLYNLMQQKISDQTQEDTRFMESIATETLRDSTSMKAIALLTMVFLPATAIGTIFSMSPFFVSATGPESIVVVSNQFWIFVVVVIPTTILIVGGWSWWSRWMERKIRGRWTVRTNSALGNARARVKDLEMQAITTAAKSG